MSKTDRDIVETQKKLSRQKVHRLEVLRRVLINCPKCHKTTRVSEWLFAQHKYWYMPSDSQGGGWFKNKDWETCSADCPNCDYEVYIYNHNRLRALVNGLEKKGVVPKQIFREVVVGDLSEATDRVIYAVRNGLIKVEP